MACAFSGTDCSVQTLLMHLKSPHSEYTILTILSIVTEIAFNVKLFSKKFEKCLRISDFHKKYTYKSSHFVKAALTYSFREGVIPN